MDPRPGNMSQNGQKTTSLMTSLTKNPQPPTKKYSMKSLSDITDVHKEK